MVHPSRRFLVQSRQRNRKRGKIALVATTPLLAAFTIEKSSPFILFQDEVAPRMRLLTDARLLILDDEQDRIGMSAALEIGEQRKPLVDGNLMQHIGKYHDIHSIVIARLQISEILLVTGVDRTIAQALHVVLAQISILVARELGLVVRDIHQ